MGKDLRSRLRSIRDARHAGSNTGSAEPGSSKKAADAASRSGAAKTAALSPPALPGAEWTGIGYLTAKRTVTMATPMAVPTELPRSLGILVPDMLRYGPAVARDLVFFDLETTGLSTGPGVVAFLAAFGRLVGDGFRVDQYLLLDYPGEAGFLEALLGEFAPAATAEGPPPLVVSYNGKSFDSQLLKTRCLMNGFPPPEFSQADLLHPSRRLWKRTLPSCSQASIETAVLDLDRSGDVPGSMAPDIWFSFLKGGDPSDLARVCDHNARDVFGLLGIFCALCRIAEDPVTGGKQFRCDRGDLALWWRRALRIHGEAAFGPGTAQTGEALLQTAAEAGHDRAAYAYRRGLAIEAEWKRKDPASALRQVDMFLALNEIQGTMADDMLRRRKRLLEKLRQKGGLGANPVVDD
jgi:uncharacterized protein YprB with RNaseH-like and TPR domain